MYCSPIWRPHLIKHILLLESVQRKATKWILQDFNSDYRSRLCKLKLLPLMRQFEFNDISFFLKSISSTSNHFDVLQFIKFSHTARSPCPRLSHKFSRYNTTRHSYFTRLPRLWNKLTESTDLYSCSTSAAKLKLYNLLWSSFLQSFDSENTCSLHHLCPCSRCVVQ